MIEDKTEDSSGIEIASIAEIQDIILRVLLEHRRHCGVWVIGPNTRVLLAKNTTTIVLAKFHNGKNLENG